MATCSIERRDYLALARCMAAVWLPSARTQPGNDSEFGICCPATRRSILRYGRPVPARAISVTSGSSMA
jgi:hypothetical protein